ncbi:hypothetical protein ACJ41P_33240 [Azospirillum argentinense]|uniref:Uncharacterized protein n=1 Tax=Azospirillum argentinense TaxID=2970906 RepID=A0ABW8VHW9_9PROT
MADRAWVSVRVDKRIDGDHVIYGVPVRFRPVIEDEKRHVRIFDRSREMVSAIAPVGSYGYGVDVSLTYGEYDVEATLPSGEPLSTELTVGSETVQVVLRGENSPNEWRSWAHFSGASLASERQVTGEFLRGPSPQTSFDVMVGSVVHAAAGGGFDPSSWNGWFDFLDERYRRGPEYFSNIQLGGSDYGLSVRTEGGFDGTPLRILFSRDGYPDYGYDITQIGARRTFAAITGHAGTRLFALPLPWGEGYHQTPFEMLAFEDGRQLRCDPILRDERWSGLVAYVNRGRVDLASEILMSARDALFEKLENPLAAAIGGYVLLSSTRGRDIKESWPRWLDNLAHRFPRLPDGAILRARWLLSQNTEENLHEAHELLYEAVERGLPFFTTGVVWLIEGLEQTSIGCPTCTDLLRMVRGVARSMDLSQAFTSFSITKPLTRGSKETRPDLSAPPGTALVEPYVQERSRRREEATTQPVIPQRQYLTLKQG